MDVEIGVLKQFIPFVLGQVKKPVNLLDGGRGSGKSRAAAQRSILKALQGRHRFGLVRKVFDTIRDSQWKEIRDAAIDAKLDHYFEFITSPLSIRCPVTGSEFICKGLDKADKIKSLATVNELWIEELTELTYEDWLTVTLTIRGQSEQHITGTFNPQEGSWIKDEFYNADGSPKLSDSVYYLHTTYHDNKFVGDRFRKQMEQLKRDNPDAYRLHGLGEWVKPQGIIYTNWDIVESLPDQKLIEFGGLDFGYFPDPAAFIKCYMSGDDIWLEEKVYENNLTNKLLCERLRAEGIESDFEFWADSAEPKSIQDLRDDGFYMCQAVEKGPDSVQHGIDLVQQKRLHILSGSTNLIKEISSYTLKKVGGMYVAGKPVDFNNHLMDALRYAIWGKCRVAEFDVSVVRF